MLLNISQALKKYRLENERCYLYPVLTGAMITRQWFIGSVVEKFVPNVNKFYYKLWSHKSKYQEKKIENLYAECKPNL